MKLCCLTRGRSLIVDAPMGAEFYEACSRVTPDIDEGHRKMRVKYTEPVFGDKEVSEVFIPAVDGLAQDLPASKVLRRRLEVRIDRFVHDWSHVGSRSGGYLSHSGLLVGQD
jgi:hypothetical protein